MAGVSVLLIFHGCLVISLLLSWLLPSLYLLFLVSVCSRLFGMRCRLSDQDPRLDRVLQVGASAHPLFLCQRKIRRPQSGGSGRRSVTPAPRKPLSRCRCLYAVIVTVFVGYKKKERARVRMHGFSRHAPQGSFTLPTFLFYYLLDLLYSRY